MDPARSLIHLGLKLTETSLDRALGVVRLIDTLLVASAAPEVRERIGNRAWPEEEEADLEALSEALRAKEAEEESQSAAKGTNAARKTPSTKTPAKKTTGTKSPGTKSPGKKTAAKKTTAKKTTATKSPAKKTAAKKSPATKSTAKKAAGAKPGRPPRDTDVTTLPLNVPGA